MPIMDVFTGDAFTARSLTAAVDTYGYVPQFLDTIPNLFVPAPIRTDKVWIEQRDFGAALIQTSPRGAPPAQRGGDQRKAKGFNTTRLADASRVWAHELQGVRAFGEEAAVKDLQLEVGRRQMKMKSDFNLTKEHMRLGCVQGIVLDADGSVIYNWFDEFGVSAPAAVVFNITSTAKVGDIRVAANGVKRTVVRNLRGLGGAAVQVHALCGDTFWDGFISSAEVRTTYQAQAALMLQNNVGAAWESFPFANITWHNYRGTDDNSAVAVPTNGCRFFPVGAGIFQVAHAPAERFEFVNTPGQETYSWIVPDRDRDSWADVEQYSYPLHVCTKPDALVKGNNGAGSAT